MLHKLWVSRWSMNQSCVQDLSHLQQKIDRLERLLVDNNHLVARLRDTLLHKQSKVRGGANISSDSTHVRAGPLPGCRLAEDTKAGADGVQVIFRC